ncbi:MAG: hypothetical protein HWD61_06710 [Parachlamydiaceae bacterium]|nr:MAG: hypothetical protein HWD61_06710 [Parachlamydiaceae bacterium]
MPTPLQQYLPSLPSTKQEQQDQSAQQSEHEKRLQELELYKLFERFATQTDKLADDIDATIEKCDRREKQGNKK